VTTRIRLRYRQPPPRAVAVAAAAAVPVAARCLPIPRRLQATRVAAARVEAAIHREEDEGAHDDVNAVYRRLDREAGVALTREAAAVRRGVVGPEVDHALHLRDVVANEVGLAAAPTLLHRRHEMLGAVAVAPFLVPWGVTTMNRTGEEGRKELRNDLGTKKALAVSAPVLGKSKSAHIPPPDPGSTCVSSTVVANNSLCSHETKSKKIPENVGAALFPSGPVQNNELKIVFKAIPQASTYFFMSEGGLMTPSPKLWRLFGLDGGLAAGLISHLLF